MALVAALDAELRERYPDSPIFGIDAESLEASGGLFVIAFCDDSPAACGAFRPFDGAAEIKRMYVRPPFRRRGLGAIILAHLEREASARGFSRGILETGTNQPEAVALYRRAGWQPGRPFGPYIGDPTSVYFQKVLAER
jgi:GNAT superfamily N-acetyltransferase